MATKEFNLSVEHREKLGTTGANALRAAGKIPAVLYGHGDVPEHIAVDAQAFEELLHRAGRNAIITLTDGGARAADRAGARSAAPSGHAPHRARRSSARLGRRNDHRAPRRSLPSASPRASSRWAP